MPSEALRPARRRILKKSIQPPFKTSILGFVTLLQKFGELLYIYIYYTFSRVGKKKSVKVSQMTVYLRKVVCKKCHRKCHTTPDFQQKCHTFFQVSESRTLFVTLFKNQKCHKVSHFFELFHPFFTQIRRPRASDSRQYRRSSDTRFRLFFDLQRAFARGKALQIRQDHTSCERKYRWSALHKLG